MYTLAFDAFVETGCSRSAAFGASAFVTAVRAAGGGGRGRISSATVADVVRHAGRRLGLLTDVFSFFSHRSLASSLHAPFFSSSLCITAFSSTSHLFNHSALHSVSYSSLYSLSLFFSFRYTSLLSSLVSQYPALWTTLTITAANNIVAPSAPYSFSLFSPPPVSRLARLLSLSRTLSASSLLLPLSTH